MGDLERSNVALSFPGVWPGTDVEILILLLLLDRRPNSLHGKGTLMKLDPSRDGHGIPKYNPFPSVVFFMLPGPSVRFRIFF